MPELPEVETVRRSLLDLIIGKTIKSVDVYYERILQNISKEDFDQALRGQTFRKLDRAGKYLIFVLNDYILVAHLRMEGKYFLRGMEPVEKHEHIVFNLTNNETLRYNDTRKFGVIYLFKTNIVDNVKALQPLNKLGIEPISGNLTVSFLKEKFKNKKEPLKTALLDQTIICGLGNIYADEVCYMCKLNPLYPANKLNDEQLETIIISSKIVLEKAINLGGTTIKSFVSSHEITGRFQNELLIHTKTKCPCCGGEVKKIRVGGRGTYYCPNCQKEYLC